MTTADRQRCAKPCKNWAVGGEWCRLHDPALADRRKAAGRIRHHRFTKTVEVAGTHFERAKVPTIAYIIDRALDIADAVDREQLDAPRAHAMVAALRLAKESLHSEREYADKTRFAWEEAQRGSGSTDDAAAKESVIPPWMQPAKPGATDA